MDACRLSFPSALIRLVVSGTGWVVGSVTAPWLAACPDTVGADGRVSVGSPKQCHHRVRHGSWGWDGRRWWRGGFEVTGKAPVYGVEGADQRITRADGRSAPDAGRVEDWLDGDDGGKAPGVVLPDLLQVWRGNPPVAPGDAGAPSGTWRAVVPRETGICLMCSIGLDPNGTALWPWSMGQVCRDRHGCRGRRVLLWLGVGVVSVWWHVGGEKSASRGLGEGAPMGSIAKPLASVLVALDEVLRSFFWTLRNTICLLPICCPQRCICQESEVLARIALRSLGRFVTSMHKAFPDASPTIIRRQATSGGDEGSTANLQEEGKEVGNRHPTAGEGSQSDASSVVARIIRSVWRATR